MSNLTYYRRWDCRWLLGGCLLPGLRGASQAGNSSDVMAHLVDLRRKKEELERQERELDEQYRRMQQCLRNISEDTSNDQYPPTLPVLSSFQSLRQASYMRPLNLPGGEGLATRLSSFMQFTLCTAYIMLQWPLSELKIIFPFSAFSLIPSPCF